MSSDISPSTHEQAVKRLSALRGQGMTLDQALDAMLLDDRYGLIDLAKAIRDVEGVHLRDAVGILDRRGDIR